MIDRRRTLVGSVLASMLSISGCGKSASNAPSLIEEVEVIGFDSNGEPMIKKWSDGTLTIHFEVMPPFFAEDDGTEDEFETFELKIQDALGVAVRREDREVFVISQPKPNSAEEAKRWLEAFRKNGIR